MPVTICKRDVSALDHEARLKLLYDVVDGIRRQLLERDDAHDTPLQEVCFECADEAHLRCECIAQRGKGWRVDINGAIAAENNQLEVRIEGVIFTPDADEESDEPSPLIYIGCLPTIAVVLYIWAWGFMRHFRLDASDPNYISTYQSKWVFLGGIGAGAVVMLISAFIMMMLGTSIKAMIERFTDRPARLLKSEQAIAAKIDLAALPEVE